MGLLPSISLFEKSVAKNSNILTSSARPCAKNIHLKCQIYSTKVATTYSEFYILMYNDDKHGDKCCVLSSHEYEEYPKCYFMWLD